MEENTYSVVIELCREDWIADYYYSHVRKCLEEAHIPTEGLTEKQAFRALNRVIRSVKNQGWPMTWIKENGRKEGVVLNNGGVLVQVQEEETFLMKRLHKYSDIRD